jgi:hypothetical protein
MPAYVGKTENSYTNESTQVVSYTPVVGNLVLMFVTVNGNGTTASVFDNAGTDIFNNPLNTWSLLGNVTMSQTGLRMELWCCAKVLNAFTDVTVVFSELNSNFNIAVLEYSDAAVGGVGSTQNSGVSNLFFVGTANNNSAVMVVGFNAQQEQPAVGAGVWAPDGKPLQQITPGVERALAGVGADNYFEVQEQTDILGDELVVEAITAATYAGNVVNGISAVGVVLTGGITLETPPGFSPVDETKLMAGNILHAITMDQISLNGEFGMVRPEFFYTLQVDGDTVPLPVSPIDGYNYSQDELYYLWTPLTTFDASTGWPSQTGILFYCEWNIDQLTGIVTCKEYYHPDGNTPVNQSSDGQLLVLTVGQRARSALGLTVPPSLATIPFADIGTDKPTTQLLMQTLAANSKFAAVKAEVIYMGEFVDGQVVPQAISPEDGYVYSYQEICFMSCWKWTTQQGAFSPPPMATANGGDADGGWSQLNELQASVSSVGIVNCQVFFQNHGAIDPSQSPNGGVAFGRLVVFAFCQRSKGPSFGIPALPNTNGLQSGSETLFIKVVAPRTITGGLSIVLSAGTTGLTISKACIKTTLTGSTTVTSTTGLTFSGSSSATVAAGAQLRSDVLSNFTMDDAHDYYILVVFNGGYSWVNLNTGLATANTPLIDYVSGDQSSVTTIPGLVSSNVWDVVSGILFNITDASEADNFQEIPFNNFAPGQPLLASAVKQIAYNVQEGCYATEFFGPTNHVNTDIVPVPTSPIDGYVYSRSELFYVWNWHDTGTAATRLFGFGAAISANGEVATYVWHCPTGGPPTSYGSGGSEPADGSIDVLVIACRTKLNPQGGSGGVAATSGTPPTDVASLAFGGSGGFTVNGGS